MSIILGMRPKRAQTTRFGSVTQRCFKSMLCVVYCPIDCAAIALRNPVGNEIFRNTVDRSRSIVEGQIVDSGGDRRDQQRGPNPRVSIWMMLSSGIRGYWSLC